LEQARYEAARAGRQYDKVEPENRIVATELERRWNERLAEVARLEEQIRTAQEMQLGLGISEAERTELMALADDLPRAWNHPAAKAETRKRILRTMLEEVVVRAEPGHLRLKLHWKGGDHTTLDVQKSRHGEHRWKTSTATEQLIHELARLLPDGSIAAVLNRLGIRSAKGHTWTQLRIRNFRAERGIAIYREGERAERGELILHEAASQLDVSKMTVIRLIKANVLPAKQCCPGAPYVILREDLESSTIRRAVESGRAVSNDSRQKVMEYE
jgi:excisionase family DNA binding protein